MALAASRALPLLLLSVTLVPAAADGPAEKTWGNTSSADDGRIHVKMVPGTSVSCFMMGTIVFLMALIYLTHWPQGEIRAMTWKLTSSTTSIFVAVMINTVLLRVVHHDIAPIVPVPLHSLIAGLSLTSLWLIVQASIFLTRRISIASTAFGTIGGHLLGFTAIHAFGKLQESPFFREQWRPVVVLPLFFLVWAVLAWIAGRLRSKIEERMLHSHRAGEREAEEVFEDTCQDCENDTVCNVLGYLVTQVVAGVIIGELPPMDDEPVTTHSQDAQLFTAAVVFLVIVFAAEALHSKEHSELVQRAFAILRGVSAMSMSWCWLFWGRWHLWRTVAMEELLAKVVLAVATSVFCMLMVFLLNWMAGRGILNPKALRAVIQAFGLLIGMAWEACFESVMQDFYPHSRRYIAAMALSIFVLPGWRLYILPKALGAWKLEHYANPPSAASLCMDDREACGWEQEKLSSDSDDYEDDSCSEKHP